MNWEEEHKKRVSEFPDDVRIAHQHSSKHRHELLSSDLCGCFYCLAIFKPLVIEEWLKEGEGTALCPGCGIDSVIGSASGFPITPEFLERMYSYWFKENKEKTDRNKQIACLVLKGYTYDQVGIIYEITRERVREITLRECRKVAPHIKGIEELRKKRNRIISLLENTNM